MIVVVVWCCIVLVVVVVVVVIVRALWMAAACRSRTDQRHTNCSL